MSIHHVTVPVRDYAESKRFYERALEPLGMCLLLDWPAGRKAWFGARGAPGSLWLCESEAAGTLELTLGAGDSGSVESFHAAALAAGARSEWEPGMRPEFNRHYYAARVRDPDGNSLEAMCDRVVAAAAVDEPVAA
jgi:catechol 2,3-dioxygenase-like lactoylglutathione lyase family enzyme